MQEVHLHKKQQQPQQQQQDKSKETLGRNHKTELKSDEKATQKEPKNNCRMPKTYEYQTLLVLFVLQGGWNWPIMDYLAAPS